MAHENLIATVARMSILCALWLGARQVMSRRKIEKSRRATLRRYAVQIAAQLPEDTDEAIYVLSCAWYLASTYLSTEMEHCTRLYEQRLMAGCGADLRLIRGDKD